MAAPLSGRRQRFLWLLLLALLIVMVCPFLGFVEIPFSALWGPRSMAEEQVLWKLRIPRVLLAFLAGASLAVSGMVFQAIFRNVLADPFTLGIASGAAFGASLAYRLGLVLGLSWLSGDALCALVGAISTMLLVVALASPSRGFTPSAMLLAGVIIGFFFSSLILLLQYLSDFSQVFRMTRWLMGSLDVVGFESLMGVAPLILLGLLVVYVMTPELNLLTLGDELAISRGLNAVRARAILFVATSLMVAGVVAVCGPIGFVGLVVPYVCRAELGSDHRLIHPACVLFGGSFLTICDTAARTLIAPSEIPVGVVTAFIGGPFFLWVLSRKAVT